MRFGQTLWSQSGEEVKSEMILVDRAYDEKNKSLGLLDPDMKNVKDMLAKTTESLSHLLTLLEGKGLINANEYQSIKDINKEQYIPNLMKFSELEDIDEFPI